MTKSNEKELVSSCLVGIKCRYDGNSCTNLKLKKRYEQGELIAVCPETLAGLPIPRVPAEQVDEKVFNKNAKDVTDLYRAGAVKAFTIAKNNNCKTAYLKSKSPMCGKKRIYDGTFSGKLIDGDGIFTRLLEKNGIKVRQP